MKTSKSPTVCIGMVVYNDGKYVDIALQSLLSQTFKDFKIFIGDDCSTDNTGEIAQEWAKKDSRVLYSRTSSRLGLVENSRSVFKRAGASDYFAWTAGHDVYRPEWLGKMVNCLNTNKDIGMAYCLTERVSGKGEPLDIESPLFDTVAMEPKERVKAVVSDASGFGNMVYGLFRSEALKGVGVFPAALLPDALLITRISLSWQIRQVNENLWERRFGLKSDEGVDFVARQKNTLYSKAPIWASLPWPIQHMAVIAWGDVVAPQAGSLKKRRIGFYLLSNFIKRRWHQAIPRVKYHLSQVGWLRRGYRGIFPRDKDN